MIFAKVDVKLRDHHRAQRAGAAMGTWLWGLLYVREHQTDGVIPDVSLRYAWVGEKAARRDAARLVEVGLWEDLSGSWRICRYSDKNDTAEDIAKRRAEARERMQRVRLNKQRTNGEPPRNCVTEVPGSGSGSGSGSDLISEGELEREAQPPEGSQARYASAYEAGVSRGKCSPFAWSGSKYAAWDLGKIIDKFAKDPKGKSYRGEQLLRFIEHTAFEFAGDVIARNVAQYYRAFEPSGCLKWLNESADADEARRVG